MKAEAIRELMHRNLPLRIRSSDGREFAVPHPDFISVGRNDFGFLIIHTDEGFTILDLPNVTAIDVDARQGSETPAE